MLNNGVKILIYLSGTSSREVSLHSGWMVRCKHCDITTLGERANHLFTIADILLGYDPLWYEWSLFKVVVRCKTTLVRLLI